MFIRLKAAWRKLVLEWRYRRWQSELVDLIVRHEEFMVNLTRYEDADPQAIFDEVVKHKRELGELMDRDPKLVKNL